MDEAEKPAQETLAQQWYQTLDAIDELQALTGQQVSRDTEERLGKLMAEAYHLQGQLQQYWEKEHSQAIAAHGPAD
jgi:hypothetical protein